MAALYSGAEVLALYIYTVYRALSAQFIKGSHSILNFLNSQEQKPQDYCFCARKATSILPCDLDSLFFLLGPNFTRCMG